MKSVYIETSIWGYLTARPSRDLLGAARQQVTRDWWDNRRVDFELFVSPLVEQEAQRGDPVAVKKRLDILHRLQTLQIIEAAYDLASTLLQKSALPRSASEDALHIAIATVHGMDYLLTWNCRHIDNAETKPIVRAVCETKGYVCPEICTPDELMGRTND